MQTIKQLGLPSKGGSSNSVVGIDIEEVISFDTSSVVETFNKYFCSVANFYLITWLSLSHCRWFSERLI